MRYTEIDGKRFEMEHCWDCPFVFSDGLMLACNHPDRSGVTIDVMIPDDCPLRSDDLLPCPFCGGEAEKFTFTSEGISKECVRCKECGMSTGWFFGTGNDKKLAKVWNRRIENGSGSEHLR